jgi:hypothetical protein
MNPSSLKSIAETYHGFQALPKGIKQMLLVSENDYFEDARPQHTEPSHPEVPVEILHLTNTGTFYQGGQAEVPAS